MRKFGVKVLGICALILLLGAVNQPTLGATPAGKTKYRITTGKPKKDGEYKVKVSWKSDGGTKQKVEAKVDVKKDWSATKKAEEIAKAIQSEINKLDPAAQGAQADQAQVPGNPPTPLPEVIIQNKAGFKLDKPSVADRTGEKDKVDPLEVSFNRAGLDCAIDLSGTPTDGMVAVTIGEGEPIVAQTLGKTTAQIDQEIVDGLNAMGIDVFISISPLAPDAHDPETPFDGSEIQFINSDAPSFTVDIDDPGLVVIYELEFGESIPTVSEWGLIVMTVLLLTAGTIVIVRRRRQIAA